MTVAAGCDVARFGRDYTAIVGVEDTKVFAMNEWNKTDLMTSVGKVRDHCDKWGVDILAIDDTGVGGAITDRLMELYEEGEIAFEIVAVNFGAKANEEDRFHNKGSEIYWRLHETLDPDTEESLKLPRHHPLIQKLVSQLSKVMHSHDSRERIWVDKTGSKGMQKRVGDPEPPSPDLADALCLALEAWSNFWDAPRQPRKYHGTSFLNG
jgi:hypothetical protein